jgi:hypothetical protein
MVFAFSLGFAVAALALLVLAAVVAAHLILWRDARTARLNAQRDVALADAANRAYPGRTVAELVGGVL